MRMRKTLMVVGLAGALAAPSLAYANCHSARVTGAVLGGLGGGAIGAAAATAPWGFAAAGMGALLGHTIASHSASCRGHYAYYYRRHRHYAYYPRRHYAYYHRAYYGGGYYHRGYAGGY